MKLIKKRLFSLKSFLLLILLLLTIASIFIVVQRGKIQENSKSIIEKQRFIETHILSGDDNKESISAGFDLKEKEFFYYHGAAIKNNKLYGGSQEYSANIKDIKDSNYQITRSTDSFINKKLLEEKQPPEFEGRYSIKDSQFSKVRITYNKEFLPTRIEWYYKGEEGLKWYTWRTYSYPFKNKADFDKKLDEEIKDIKEIQMENEGD